MKLFKNHRDTEHRVALLTGHTVCFGPQQEREVPDALAQACIEAGLTPVTEAVEAKGGSRTGKKAE
jgi:hypothetical protein